MNYQQRVSAFIELGRRISLSLERNGTGDEVLFDPDLLANRIKAANPWFTELNVFKALGGIVKMLKADAMAEWLKKYPNPGLVENMYQKRPLIGIVMAGNIPAVGFHDMLCALVAGHDVLIRLSSKDQILPREISLWLSTIEPAFKKRIIFSEDPMKGMDAVIATGSNNTGRYFEHYFGKVPHIFRRNRFSAAILNGDENNEQLKALSDDVFSYFGMGCRNVSRLYLPEGFHPEKIIKAFAHWEYLANHSKYFNNYEYNKSIALINGEPFFDAGFFILKQDSSGAPPPLAVVYYDYYSNTDELTRKLEELRAEIQCIVHHSEIAISGVEFGQSQLPKPSDYADDIDTLLFLQTIKPSSGNAQ